MALRVRPMISSPASEVSKPPLRRGWLATLRALRAARRDPSRLGDSAILSSELLGVQLSRDTRAAVELLCERRGGGLLRPALDRHALRALPPGTFGRELVEFCEANRIPAITVSEFFADDELRRISATVRYIVTHDMFHVLLGYDTSLPDEIGVTGFVVGQRYFPRAWLVFAFQCVFAVLLRPHHARRTLTNLCRGYRTGRRAAMLLAEPLEDYLAEDLRHLQRRLGLRDEPAPL